MLQMKTDAADAQTPKTLPSHAALIPSASRLGGAARGWYFAVLVRAAYARLEASA